MPHTPDWIISPADHRRVPEGGAVAARMTALGIRAEVTDAAPARYGRRRDPECCGWLGWEAAAELRCRDCGDTAAIYSTALHAPQCSCEALSVAEQEQATARLGRIADARAARSGRCCIEGCALEGRHWRRATTVAGLRAVRTCDRHEILGERLLAQLTMADAVRLATPSQRRRALERAREADAAAATLGRRSAELAGASSLTHTAALCAGYYEDLANRERAFAVAVAGREGD